MNNEQNNDELVTAAYRDLACETTPPQLDEAVLRMAADSKRQNASARIPLWMKPAAWAATIGLSLAIVLDVTEVGDTTQIPATPSPAASIEEAFAADDADVVKEAEEMARLRDGPSQPADLAKARQETAVRNDQGFAQDAVASQAEPAAARSLVAFEVDAEKKEALEPPLCSEASQESAESWYECIQRLREVGRDEDADRELQMLLERFRQFQPE